MADLTIRAFDHSGDFCEEAYNLKTAIMALANNEDALDNFCGYLSMHFGAAEERILERQKAARRVIIGVVCASGLPISWKSIVTRSSGSGSILCTAATV